jgi:hypothetical protein
MVEQLNTLVEGKRPGSFSEGADAALKLLRAQDDSGREWGADDFGAELYSTFGCNGEDVRAIYVISSC